MSSTHASQRAGNNRTVVRLDQSPVQISDSSDQTQLSCLVVLQGNETSTRPPSAQDSADLSEFVSACHTQQVATLVNAVVCRLVNTALNMLCYCQVQNLLQQMQGRFQTMSDSIISRVDEMGSKIDDLEKQIGELVQQSGVEDRGQKQATKRQSS